MATKKIASRSNNGLELAPIFASTPFVIAPKDASTLASRVVKRLLFEPQAYSIATINTGRRDGRAGKCGMRGFSGISGSTGSTGAPGSRGGNGHAGRDGTDGMRAGHGWNGASAGNVNLSVWGTPEELCVWRSDSTGPTTYNLNDKGFILIDSKGGDGGVGGVGGNAGHGGNGGRGGRGGKGRPGAPTSVPGHDGGRGGRGGDGGDGGRGGNGGDGGRAGNGGHGGYGGFTSITVDEHQTHLLWLFESDARKGRGAPPGAPGLGGKNGFGGMGGFGGQGGQGGSGGPAKTVTETVDGVSRTRTIVSAGKRGTSGASGNSGHRGSTGRCGREGSRGRFGRDGIDGAVSFNVARQGSVIYTARDRFDPVVTKFVVYDDNDDGVFEPGTEILLSEITVTNDGEMALPYGSYADMICEENCLPAGISFPLPVLAAKQTFTTPREVIFRAKLPEAGELTMGQRFKTETSVSTRVSLLRRAFPDSVVESPRITVEWPLYLEILHNPDWSGVGEITAVKLRVVNISRRMYGGTMNEPLSDGSYSAGVAAVHFSVDPFMEILQNDAGSYTIENNGSLATFVLPPIPGHGYVDIDLSVRMRAEAGTKLFMRLPWRADLSLRGRYIQYFTNDIRVTPVFSENTFSDVLLVTSRHITRELFLAYSYMLQLLGLSVNFWDLQRYSGLSSEKVTWVNTTRTVIFPNYASGTDKGRAVQLVDSLRFPDFLKHMNSTTMGAAKEQGAIFVGEKGAALTVMKMHRLLYDLTTPALGRLGMFGPDGHIQTAHSPKAGGDTSVHPAPAAPAAMVMSDGASPVPSYISNFAEVSGVRLTSPHAFPTKIGTQDLMHDERHKAPLHLSGGGSMCFLCSLCTDDCSTDPYVVLRNHSRKFNELNSAKRYLTVVSAGKTEELLEVGCFSSTTGEAAVYEGIFSRDAGVSALSNNDLVAAGAFLPYVFANGCFSTNKQAWNDSPFTQLFLAVLAAMPVERRLESTSYDHLNSIHFVVKGGKESTGMGSITVPYCLAVASTIVRDVVIEAEVTAANELSQTASTTTVPTTASRVANTLRAASAGSTDGPFVDIGFRAILSRCLQPPAGTSEAGVAALASLASELAEITGTTATDGPIEINGCSLTPFQLTDIVYTRDFSRAVYPTNDLNAFEALPYAPMSLVNDSQARAEFGEDAASLGKLPALFPLVTSFDRSVVAGQAQSWFFSTMEEQRRYEFSMYKQHMAASGHALTASAGYTAPTDENASLSAVELQYAAEETQAVAQFIASDKNVPQYDPTMAVSYAGYHSMPAPQAPPESFVVRDTVLEVPAFDFTPYNSGTDVEESRGSSVNYSEISYTTAPPSPPAELGRVGSDVNLEALRNVPVPNFAPSAAKPAPKFRQGEQDDDDDDDDETDGEDDIDEEAQKERLAYFKSQGVIIPEVVQDNEPAPVAPEENAAQPDDDGDDDADVGYHVEDDDEKN